jgi:hypothetical protein
MDNETIKITREIGGKNGKRIAEIVRRKNATRFMWMPGIRPVKTPIKVPAMKAKSISISIKI